MSAFDLKIPDDFADYQWEVEAKGFFGNVELIFEDNSFYISFYDHVRLMQEINDELSSNGLFFENNLIILEKVTKASMVESIEKLIKSRDIGDLKPAK